jgi:hypothetical protein
VKRFGENVVAWVLGVVVFAVIVMIVFTAAKEL